jgi:hypothetical protein
VKKKNRYGRKRGEVRREFEELKLEGRKEKNYSIMRDREVERERRVECGERRSVECLREIIILWLFCCGREIGD